MSPDGVGAASAEATRATALGVPPESAHGESLRRFLALTSEDALVPVWRDCLLDADTPVSAFAKLRRGPFAFLLESAPAGRLLAHNLPTAASRHTAGCCNTSFHG